MTYTLAKIEADQAYLAKIFGPQGLHRKLVDQLQAKRAELNREGRAK